LQKYSLCTQGDSEGLLFRDEEAGASNPLAPTFYQWIRSSSGEFIPKIWSSVDLLGLTEIVRLEIFACVEISRIVALFGISNDDGKLNTFGAAAYSRVGPLPSLTASMAKRINASENSENVGPLIVHSGESLPRERRPLI
jgi:hypothetical protein